MGQVKLSEAKNIPFSQVGINQSFMSNTESGTLVKIMDSQYIKAGKNGSIQWANPNQIVYVFP